MKICDFMATIRCRNCVHAYEETEKREGTGKENIEYIKKLKCDLFHEIGMGGIPGPDCDGVDFKEK